MFIREILDRIDNPGWKKLFGKGKHEGGDDEEINKIIEKIKEIIARKHEAITKINEMVRRYVRLKGINRYR